MQMIYAMIKSTGELGARTIGMVRWAGKGAGFLLPSFLGMLAVLRRPRLIIQQLYSVGVLSMVIIVIAGFFVGMVLGLQGYIQLSAYKAESALGLGVALTLSRELGPVVTALLFAGRAGSALTAEIGLMRATDQLAAMEMMAVNPYERVIGPRFWAGIISMPLLAAMFSVVGIYGSWLVGVGQFGIDHGIFWSTMEAGVEFGEDILNGVVKSAIFGIVVTGIALFEGYYAKPTSEGVSRATTRTVVNSSLCILALDYLLTSLMFGGPA
jgi:phospholipid/cholesterol/gamma-HCH transport system permease protein